MGMARHDAYTLLLQGERLLDFINGLSTNLVNGPCTTVFTNRAAQIVDVCEVIPVGDSIALVGFLSQKDMLIKHLSDRILGQPITISDISGLNDVFIGLPDEPHPPGTTVHQSHFGTVYVIPKKLEQEPSWTDDEWTEHRIANMVPFYGHEITPHVHPLACGLGDLVHPQKGCYVGQEVLTRMRSRGKLGRRLAKVDNPAKNATTVGTTHSLVLERIQ
ncbi:MAG: hypothetical protein VXY14_05075 [Candidatus Thermoplasmatota archaeon]|nr:hypothetical protein [Candidatus Thermoplasmatota archaeon]